MSYGQKLSMMELTIPSTKTQHGLCLPSLLSISRSTCKQRILDKCQLCNFEKIQWPFPGFGFPSFILATLSRIVQSHHTQGTPLKPPD